MKENKLVFWCYGLLCLLIIVKYCSLKSTEPVRHTHCCIAACGDDTQPAHPMYPPPPHTHNPPPHTLHCDQTQCLRGPPEDFGCGQISLCYRELPLGEPWLNAHDPTWHQYCRTTVYNTYSIPLDYLTLEPVQLSSIGLTAI